MDRGHRNVRHADGVSARLPDNQCDLHEALLRVHNQGHGHGRHRGHCICDWACNDRGFSRILQGYALQHVLRSSDGVDHHEDNQCDHRALSQDVRNLDHVGVRG